MILATNDDGIGSPGLRHLVEALREIDDVWVVAPDAERSGVGMAITIDRPLRAKPAGSQAFAVDGTPVDCVDLAVGELLPSRPNLVVSGINLGQNVGHDVHFSGTVAAARKGTFLGLASIAFSVVHGDPWQFDTAATIARRIAKMTLDNGLPEGVLLNVNIPNVAMSDLRGIRVVPQDLGPYDTHVLTRRDKLGRPYHWIGGKRLDSPNRAETDVGVVSEGYVTITPLQPDMTAYDLVPEVTRWSLDL